MEIQPRFKIQYPMKNRSNINCLKRDPQFVSPQSVFLRSVIIWKIEFNAGSFTGGRSCSDKTVVICHNLST
jgi:hypothetical protein